jgi:S-adenosylmethionine:tRNA ribosyltransferase-isomerase
MPRTSSPTRSPRRCRNPSARNRETRRADEIVEAATVGESMRAASRAVQRPADARLLVVDAAGGIEHASRSHWLDYLRGGDTVVANDAATLPASLHGVHARSASPIEVRLAAWRRGARADSAEFDAIVFGAGDWRIPTENRPLPPALAAGDVLRLGPLVASVAVVLGHPRLVRLAFAGSIAAFWRGLAAHGRPVQYAHLDTPLALWDAWTPIAAAPLAFEPPSAGFALDWRSLTAMHTRGIRFATLTHAAGLSSSGDLALDARLPLDEAYRIPPRTAACVARVRRDRTRIVAIGTTVVRALEHAARDDGIVRSGEATATQRIGARTRLRVVDALVTGTHAPGSSHHELLRAFASDDVLARVGETLEHAGYTTHEFGDSMLVMRNDEGASARQARTVSPRIASATR